MFQFFFSSPSLVNKLCSKDFKSNQNQHSSVLRHVHGNLPVCRDATKAVPPKSKGGRLFDFTLLCCKSHKSSDVFSILNLHFLDSPPKMRGFVCFVPPENRPTHGGLMRFAQDSTPGATPGTCADEWSVRARQLARFEVSTTGLWSAPHK